MKANIRLGALLLMFSGGMAGTTGLLAATGCSAEGTLFSVQYLGACAYEQSDSFTLTSSSYVTKIRLWYDTSKYSGNLSATITKPDGTTLSQVTTKGGCQGFWCEGNLIINDILPAGRYAVATSTTAALCHNPSGDSTVAVYGCASNAATFNQSFDVVGSASGGESNLSLSAALNTESLHAGKTGEVYVAANYSNQWYFNKDGGWQTLMAPYFAGTLPASMTIPVVSGMNLSALTGLGVYVGYGLDVTDMLGANRYKKIYTVTGPSIAGGTLFTAPVAPSSALQTVTTPDNKVSVSIPGGVLSQAENLTVTAETGRTDTAVERFTNLGVYRIALDSTSEFQKNITLEFSFDPAATDSSLQNGGKFITAYYDQNLNAWVSQRNTVDLQRGKVVVQTNHLSTWGVWMALKGYKAYYQRHFTIYYYPGDVLPATFGSTTIADFAFGLGQACEAAYGTYGAAGFKMPTYTADVLVLNRSDAQRITVAGPGDIEIGFANLKTADMGYTACGHEVFHSVQNESFNLIKAAISKSHVWMIEGTPDYASWAVGFGKQYAEANVMEGGLDADYFVKSPFTDEAQHAYQLFYWWKYLDTQKGIKFPGAWNYLAANSGVASSTSVKAMEDYVAQQAGTAFPSIWSDFVNFTYFDAKSDLGWSKFRTNTITYRSNMLSDTTSSVNLTYSLAADYTADVRRIISVASNKATTISSTNDLADGVTLEVWQMPNDTQDTALAMGGATRKGTLSGSSKTVNVDLNTTDGMYLVAKNTSASVQGMSITVASVAQFAITSLSPSSGAIGTTVTITGTGFGTVAGTVSIAPTNSLPKTATLISWTDTRITATIPTGAKTGVIILTKPGGSQTDAANGKVFTVATAAALVNNGNGTITQSSAGLLWQQQDDGVRRSWDDASAYCAALSLGAFSSGWKLPTQTQLVGLVDKTQTPTISTSYFTNTKSSIYWTSSAAGGSYNVWYVDFGDGSSTYTGKNQYDYYSRCVHTVS